MIQKNEELASKKVRLAVAQGGILMAPVIALALGVWVYTQRWSGLSSNMDIAIIGVNTASLLLAIYVGYFVIGKVSDKAVHELEEEGLLVSGARVAMSSEPLEVSVASEILDGVDFMTSFNWVRKPVKKKMLAIEPPKAKPISLAKADA